MYILGYLFGQDSLENPFDLYISNETSTWKYYIVNKKKCNCEKKLERKSVRLHAVVACIVIPHV